MEKKVTTYICYYLDYILIFIINIINSIKKHLINVLLLLLDTCLDVMTLQSKLTSYHYGFSNSSMLKYIFICFKLI